MCVVGGKQTIFSICVVGGKQTIFDICDRREADYI